MSRLDPNSDLATKQILINIPNDQDFLNACATSKTMMALCEHADLWEERLRRYYPLFVELKDRTQMTWQDIYIFAHLLKGVREKWIRQHALHISQVNQLVPKDIQRLANIIFEQRSSDYIILLEYVPAGYILKSTIDHLLRRLVENGQFYLFYDVIGQIANHLDMDLLRAYAYLYIAYYASVDSIFETYMNENTLRDIYKNSYIYWTQEKMDEYKKKYRELFGNTDNFPVRYF